MAMFSYLYYNSYVGAEVGVTVGSVLSSAVQLSRKQQLELWGLLANLLAGIHLTDMPPMPFNGTVIFNTEIWGIWQVSTQGLSCMLEFGWHSSPSFRLLLMIAHLWSPIDHCPTQVAYMHIHQLLLSARTMIYNDRKAPAVKQ